jgi:beta-glucosidase
MSGQVEANRSVEERVEDLLAVMTLEEKLAQLGAVWAFELLRDAEFDADRVRAALGRGIGQITRISGATGRRPREAAELANQVQRFLVEETRLGIPAIVHEESLHGILGRDRVCFPQSLGLASSWDPALVREMADRIGRELRAAGAQQTLAPIFDITRDPRWGRTEETYGEDPYLVAAFGTAYTEGVQGADRGRGPDGVLATGKHLVGHGLPEGGLNHAPAHIGTRELRDSFLFPFEAAVRSGGLRSMMHAYDDVDGIPCVASRELLTTILREEWGFDGIVVADYGGINELITSHAVTEDLGEAGARALESGVDVELPSVAAYGEPLRRAVESGRVDIATVDESVRRVLREKVALGLFEHPYVDLDAPDVADPKPAVDLRIARELARRSIVLLANDGILPIADGAARIAVIGPNADNARHLLGDYCYEAHIETLIENRDRAQLLGLDMGTDVEIGSDVDELDTLAGRRTILDAIRDRAGAGTEIRFAQGCGILDGDDAGIEAAVAAARGADLAIVVAGERSGLTDAATSGEARDRLELGLPGRQAELVAAVVATGTPVILVLVAGRPLAIPTEAGTVAAVVHAWVPGDEGPDAIAEVLFGDVTPGGKLPITVPRHVGQVPVYHGHRPSGGRSHWKEDYVDGSHLPLWPFGFGLSYTTFELGGLTIDLPTFDADGEARLSVDVANTGDRRGAEVVQVYVRDVEASVTRPVRELRGFARVELDPGERRTVTFGIPADLFAFTGVDLRLRLEPGRFEIMVGTSSVDLPLRGEVELTGEAIVPFSRRRYFTTVEIR